jgi:hypothetical protein
MPTGHLLEAAGNLEVVKCLVPNSSNTAAYSRRNLVIKVVSVVSCQVVDKRSRQEEREPTACKFVMVALRAGPTQGCDYSAVNTTASTTMSFSS